MGIKDIFGGVVADARQYRDGHFFVGVGTTVEHCMRCRIGADRQEAHRPCPGHANCRTCGAHLDEHGNHPERFDHTWAP